MAGFYRKDLKFDSGLINNIGANKSSAIGKAGKAMGDTMMQLGNIKQNKTNRDKNNANNDTKMNLEKDKFSLEKKKVDLNQESKKSKQTQDANDRSAKISAFRKMHPKTTADLTDDEIYQLGDSINKIDSDASAMKFKDSFVAENGHRIGIFSTGKMGKDNKPIYERVDFGKVKDYNKSKDPSDDDFDPMGAKYIDSKKLKSKSSKKSMLDLNKEFDLDI